jgi:hypothetical protein
LCVRFPATQCPEQLSNLRKCGYTASKKSDFFLQAVVSTERRKELSFIAAVE